MDASLLLPWFPVLLGVGLGGRLLGKARGLFLGFMGASFWALFVYAPMGGALWASPLKLLALLAGAAAIVAMGAWAGETAEAEGQVTGTKSPYPASTPARPPSTVPVSGTEQRVAYPASMAADAGWTRLADALERFQNWLEDNRHDDDPWPKFDELIRSTLYHMCHATHVKPFRLAEDNGELVPLRHSDPLSDPDGLSARGGIIGHVVTTGRFYAATDPEQGELIHRLAKGSPAPVAWCFPVTCRGRRVGVVVVGSVESADVAPRQLLITVQRAIQLFWITLQETCDRRTAAQLDAASGVLNRESFFHAASLALQASYRQGEPVACAVIAIEGLRQLHDTGGWDQADELIRTVCNLLRRKVRLDDVLGRFDGSRFILLLRRVDSELAALIIDQLMFRLRGVCEENPRWPVAIHIRCGVVGTGVGQPELRALVAEALQQAAQARHDDTVIASDLLPTALAGAGEPVAEQEQS